MNCATALYNELTCDLCAAVPSISWGTLQDWDIFLIVAHLRQLFMLLLLQNLISQIQFYAVVTEMFNQTTKMQNSAAMIIMKCKKAWPYYTSSSWTSLAASWFYNLFQDLCCNVPYAVHCYANPCAHMTVLQWTSTSAFWLWKLEEDLFVLFKTYQSARIMHIIWGPFNLCLILNLFLFQSDKMNTHWIMQWCNCVVINKSNKSKELIPIGSMGDNVNLLYYFNNAGCLIMMNSLCYVIVEIQKKLSDVSLSNCQFNADITFAVSSYACELHLFISFSMPRCCFCTHSFFLTFAIWCTMQHNNLELMGPFMNLCKWIIWYPDISKSDLPALSWASQEQFWEKISGSTGHNKIHHMESLDKLALLMFTKQKCKFS